MQGWGSSSVPTGQQQKIHWKFNTNFNGVGIRKPDNPFPPLPPLDVRWEQTDQATHWTMNGLICCSTTHLPYQRPYRERCWTLSGLTENNQSEEALLLAQLGSDTGTQDPLTHFPTACTLFGVGTTSALALRSEASEPFKCNLAALLTHG